MCTIFENKIFNSKINNKYCQYNQWSLFIKLIYLIIKNMYYWSIFNIISIYKGHENK